MARPALTTSTRPTRGPDRDRAAPLLVQYVATITRRVQRLTAIVLTGLVTAAVGGCGFADMHVHLRSTADMDRLLDAGVTFVRNMWGTTTTRALIELVASGERPGPRIASVSTGIDGFPPTHTPSEVLVDPTDAEGIVDRQLAAGWTTLKVYQGLSLEAYLALADAARERSVPLVGHVPTAVPLATALTDMRSIEHLEGYDKALNGGVRERAFRAWTHIDAEGMGTLADATAEADTWISPTLLVAARMLHRNLPATVPSSS